MTDKQIIIDGCDVSGCEHFSGTYAKECKAVYANSGYKELHDLKCNKSPNCYYKQLKAKEQECEELRKANDEKNELLAKLGCPTIATARRKVFCLQEQLDQLKAENDELKKLLKVRIEDLCDSCGASSMMPMPCKVYEKTLTEIKEYLKPYLFRGGVEPQWVEWQMAQREKEKMAKDIFQILQKISEVEDE